MLIHDCIPCQHGDHEHCQGGQAAPKGVMGGWRCGCSCRETRAGTVSEPRRGDLARDPLSDFERTLNLPTRAECERGMAIMLGWVPFTKDGMVSTAFAALVAARNPSLTREQYFSLVHGSKGRRVEPPFADDVEGSGHDKQTETVREEQNSGKLAYDPATVSAVVDELRKRAAVAHPEIAAGIRRGIEHVEARFSTEGGSRGGDSTEKEDK